MRVLSWKSSCSVLALTAGWLVAPAAFAQQPVAIELPTVEVTGSKKRPAKATDASGVEPGEVVVSPTSVPTSNEKIASSVTVITSEELQRTQRRTVAEALQTVPGLNVVQTGGPGGQTAVFIRGTESNHVKVLIDGMDMSDASTPSGGLDFGHLLTADIEQIEVLRGPQGGLYGANAIGGVISIITKQGKGPPKLTALVEGGSFGTFNQAVGASGSQGAFHYAFNIAHRRTTDMPVTPLSLLPPGQPRHSDFYDNWTYSTKMGVDVSRNFSLNMVARYTDATLRFSEDEPFAFPTFPFATQSITDVRQFFGRGEAVLTSFGGAFKNYFGMTYTDQQRLNESQSLLNRPEYKGEQVKYDWRGVATVAPGQVVVMGLETRTDKMFAAASTFDPAVTAEQDNKAGYLELQSQLAKRLFLVANVRHDDNEAFGSATTWRVAPAYILPGTETKLKASVGTGFKAPSLYEIYGPNGNPNLQPEESIGYDFGFEQPLLNDKVRFGVTYFHNDIKNLITFSSSPPFPWINIDQAKTSGYEVFAAAVLSRSLSVRADYTYTDIDVVSGPVLRRRPQNKASASATWTPFDAFTLSTTVIYVGERLDVDRADFSSLKLEDYTIVNMAADYKLSDTVSLFGRIDNLFNEQYQDPSGWERPGFSVFAGLRVSSR